MYPYYQQFKAVTQAISENDEEEHLLNLSHDGKPLSPDSEQQADMIYKHFITCLEKFASDTEELNDRSIQDVIQADYEQLADTHGHLKSIIDCCLADIEMYEASDLAELSAKEWRTPQESARCDQWVSYGYGTLLERIVDQYKLAIRLNTLVTHIDTRNSDQIAVKVADVDSPIFCRYVLITVPLGV
ncbi:hypothetical protein I4U23_015816 [Adineta vaga]|nr:hypothetical protein I4U23_015816 [Adineta vaga]